MTRARLLRFLLLAGLLCGLLAGSGSEGVAAQPFQPVFGDPMLEPWRWRTFPQLNGLHAQCLAEGADGSMWFGTNDGLWHCDGTTWTPYAEEAGLFGGVTTAAAAADGAMWVAGRWGIINRFEAGRWTAVFPLVRARFGEVRHLLRARDGAMWAATAWGALREQGGGWTLYTSPARRGALETELGRQGLEIVLLPDAVLAAPGPGGRAAVRRDDFTAIAEDGQGRIWLGTEVGEVICFAPAAAAPGGDAAVANGGTWTLHSEADGLVCGRVPSILARPDGAVWVVSGVAGAHANVFADGRWTTFRLADAGLPDDGGTLFQTRDGVLWLSGRYVLCAQHAGGWRTYTQPEVPIPTARNFLLQSTDGALWIVGTGTEIVRVDYQTPRWQTLHDLNFHAESATGAQWFLHRSGRVVVRTGETWQSLGPEDGVIDAPVVLLCVRSGDVWVAGSHQGTAATARFDGRSWTRVVHEELAWGIEPRGVIESADGSVWFSAAVDSSGPAQHRRGILRWRGGEWQHHHQPGRAPAGRDDSDPSLLLPATQRPEPIGKFAILGESGDGKLWAGRNLLAVRDAERWSLLAPPLPVRGAVLEAMFTTREGALWIGTRQFGALRYQAGEWAQFQGKDSLVANSVRSITQTTDGTIWVATDHDVSRYDGQTWTPRVLPAAFHLPHEGGALKMSPPGALWINRTAPDWNRRAWRRGAPVDVTTCEFRTARHQVQGPPPETTLLGGDERVSPPGNLSVLWSGAAPWRDAAEERLQFSFRLDGAPWSAFTAERGHAFFTLAPGSHRLEVRARDLDFNVDPTPAVLDFVVLPPVWRQGWFLVLVAGLMVLLGAQTTRVFLERGRLRRANRGLAAEVVERERAEEALRRLNVELDQRVQARTAELETANHELEAFSYSVSHDLRAPLRVIDGFSRILQEEHTAGLNPDALGCLDRVRTGAQRMGRLIDDMLSLSRVTRGELRLGRVDLSQLVRAIVDELQAREPERVVRCAIAPGVSVTGDVRFLRIALENLLGNAWKFTAKRTAAEITFGVTTAAGAPLYFVRDNGAGFDMEHAGRLFQPFRRLHTEADFPGTGIGLATVHRIVQRHGGRVWAEGRVGEGATMWFTLTRSAPVDDAAGGMDRVAVV